MRAAPSSDRRVPACPFGDATVRTRPRRGAKQRIGENKFARNMRFLRTIRYFCTNNKTEPNMMKNVIRLHDKTFRVMIPAAQIDSAVAAVAERINADYRDKQLPLFIGVLNGSFMFMSDLMKKIEFDCELSFVKLASYCGTCTTGDVRSLIGLNNSIEGRHVIIVEDIVDTGESIEHMVRDLESRRPASISVCTLFFKPDSY